MQLSDFNYALPAELIAQEPLKDRSASRMLVVHRKSGVWEDRFFSDLPSFLAAGDCLILNDSKVLPSRLFGRKVGYERQVELFLLRPVSADRLTWNVLARPGRHLHEGARVYLTPRLYADVEKAGYRGERTVRFTCTTDIDEELNMAGHVPLPPYIHRPDFPADRDRYQTIYAEKTGSVAAPTAGLHFTEEVLAACTSAGAEIARVTLHVGLGTFQPLSNQEVTENRLHTEHYEISESSAQTIASAQRRIAVGTTSVRTIESAALNGGMHGHTGATEIFIYPGFQFRLADAMLTNFHLPMSSLFLLVSAFAGKELMQAAYQHAIKERYRFFSYGDCMLIL